MAGTAVTRCTRPSCDPAVLQVSPAQPGARHLIGWFSSPRRRQTRRRPGAVVPNRANRIGGWPARARVNSCNEGICDGNAGTESYGLFALPVGSNPPRQCSPDAGGLAVANPDATQTSPASGIVAELEAEGYHDAEPVGRGGFGVVYRCNEPSLDRVVAVKVLSSDPDDVDVEHFNHEQRAMGRVSGHPNIVPVLHSGVTFAGRPYIVMQYHRRDSLGAWIRGHGPLGVREALEIGVRLAGALETAHRAGVLHRDVKPSNVLLTAYGEPQLGDFGIARMAGGRETSSQRVVGSLAYIAPELFEGAAASVASGRLWPGGHGLHRAQRQPAIHGPIRRASYCVCSSRDSGSDPRSPRAKAPRTRSARQ